MPANNTKNIYSAEYEQGMGPTTAADVSYDNTTSHLTADDVQEAIDECAAALADIEASAVSSEGIGDATNVQDSLDYIMSVKIDGAYDNTVSGLSATSIQGAIDEVAGELSDLSLNGYAITDFLSVQYTPDNDTYGTALDGIASLMNDIVSALENDEMLVANNIVITNVATLICRNQPHYNTDSFFNAVAFSVAAGQSSLSLLSAVIYGGSGSSYIDKAVIDNNGASFDNITSTSLTSTNVIRLSYYKYKKIKSEV